MANIKQLIRITDHIQPIKIDLYQKSQKDFVAKVLKLSQTCIFLVLEKFHNLLWSSVI